MTGGFCIATVSFFVFFSYNIYQFLNLFHTQRKRKIELNSSWLKNGKSEKGSLTMWRLRWRLWGCSLFLFFFFHILDFYLVCYEYMLKWLIGYWFFCFVCYCSGDGTISSSTSLWTSRWCCLSWKEIRWHLPHCRPSAFWSPGQLFSLSCLLVWIRIVLLSAMLCNVIIY